MRRSSTAGREPCDRTRAEYGCEPGESTVKRHFPSENSASAPYVYRPGMQDASAPTSISPQRAADITATASGLLNITSSGAQGDTSPPSYPCPRR
ncbi:MAG: hypothetical protein IKP53_01945 [Candidatus Methanomethylophilaceae archaeon]|nr:hypothetical protein [Candidatus Methanomethylophilaceae archaeon]